MAAVLFFTVIYFVLAVPLAIGLGHLVHYRLPPRDDREVWKSGTAERLHVSNGTVRAVKGLTRTNPFTVVARLLDIHEACHELQGNGRGVRP